MNEKSGFSPNTTRFDIEELLKRIIADAEKRLRLTADRDMLHFSDGAIRCKCGNPICSLAEQELANTIVERNKHGNRRVLCAACGNVLFSRKRKRQKRPDGDKCQPHTSPPESKDTAGPQNKKNHAVRDSSASVIKLLQRLIVGTIGIAAALYVIYITSLILDAKALLKRPETSVVLTEYLDRGGTPPCRRTETGHAEIIRQRIRSDFSECAVGYGISEMSDTSAVITSVTTDLLIKGKISPTSMTESFLIDEILARDSIDLRDAQKYKDVIKCLLNKLGAY